MQLPLPSRQPARAAAGAGGGGSPVQQPLLPLPTNAGYLPSSSNVAALLPLKRDFSAGTPFLGYGSPPTAAAESCATAVAMASADSSFFSTGPLSGPADGLDAMNPDAAASERVSVADALRRRRTELIDKRRALIVSMPQCRQSSAARAHPLTDRARILLDHTWRRACLRHWPAARTASQGPARALGSPHNGALDCAPKVYGARVRCSPPGRRAVSRPRTGLPLPLLRALVACLVGPDAIRPPLARARGSHPSCSIGPIGRQRSP